MTTGRMSFECPDCEAGFVMGTVEYPGIWTCDVCGYAGAFQKADRRTPTRPHYSLTRAEREDHDRQFYETAEKHQDSPIMQLVVRARLKWEEEQARNPTPATPRRSRDDQLRELLRMSGVHPSEIDKLAGAGNFDQRWTRHAVEATPKGGLLLMGPADSGKTFAACLAILTQCFEDVSKELATPRARIFHTSRVRSLDWKDPSTAAVFETMRTVRVLVIDDLGTEQGSAHAGWLGRLDEVMDHRFHRKGLRTIVTTNVLDPAVFRRRYGDRLWRRLGKKATADGIIDDAGNASDIKTEVEGASR